MELIYIILILLTLLFCFIGIPVLSIYLKEKKENKPLLVLLFTIWSIKHHAKTKHGKNQQPNCQ